MGVLWSDEVDEILGGDLAVALAYATPARGVVITPMAPLGIRDRKHGTVTLTSSLGLPKKLARIRSNPSVAVAYHAREHGLTQRSEFVLVQGRASIGEPDRAWLESITPQWERFLGPRERGPVGRWLRVYYWERVAIEIAVERILVWAEASCTGEPRVIGDPLPASPPAQKPPANGTGPRIELEPQLRGAARLPHTLAGWLDGDGLPMVVSARVGEAGAEGLALELPAANLPAGGRRAGLTSHSFEPRMHGQEQRIHTGWLSSEGGRHGTYAPHTRSGAKLPPSRALFDLGAGAATRMGMRQARKLGLAG